MKDAIEKIKNMTYGVELELSNISQREAVKAVVEATGGTLTTLAESGSGTLAGGAQMDVWRQIVRSDAKLIAAAHNRICSTVMYAKKEGAKQ